MKHVFIVNPISGQGSYKTVVDLIHKVFKDTQDFEILYTRYVGHAKELAESITSPARVYAVGGDGTAHEVLNGLDPNVPLGIIPVGSGNDFVKMYLKKSDIEEILIRTIQGDIKKVDVGRANDILFLNCFNVGLDAEVNVMVNNIRKPWVPRSLIYAGAALTQISKGYSITLSYTIDGIELKQSIVLSSIMNGKWYGGGFKSAPEAILDDGYLDICIVESIPRRQIFPLLPVYQKGNHRDLDIVTMKKVKDVLIKAPEEFIYGCDGEIFKSKEVQVQVMPEYLSLIMPDF